MAKALEIWPLHIIEEALGGRGGRHPLAGDPERRAARPVAAASHRYAALSGRPAGDHRQRRAGAGVGRHRQRAYRGAVGGAAGIRRGDGVAVWLTKGFIRR